MSARVTTRCCSALALIAAAVVVVSAQSTGTRPRTVDRTPPALFPLQTVWTLALNDQLVAQPAYDKTLAFFPIAGDRLVAYGLRSGAQLWMVSSQVQLDPVVGDGLVFVAEPDTLRAVQAGDGESAWEVPLTEPLAVRPTWDNGWLIAATRNGSILAFRARDGQPIWSRSVGSPAHAAPALAGDHVYVPTEDSRVIALRVETGAPVWERRLGGAPGDVLALEDRLYVGAKDNYFYSIKTQDGSVAWRWRTGADVVGRPIVDDDRVYFVALDNVLRALARGSGNQHWMKPLPLRPTTGPVQAGSTVLVTGLAPTVRAFNMSDGAEAGELAVAPEPAAPPYVFEDPVTSLPMVVYFTKDLASGATATLVTRTFEPPILQIAPLPNLITFGPPTTP